MRHLPEGEKIWFIHIQASIPEKDDESFCIIYLMKKLNEAWKSKMTAEYTRNFCEHVLEGLRLAVATHRRLTSSL